MKDFDSDSVDWDKLDIEKAELVLSDGKDALACAEDNFEYLDGKIKSIRNLCFALLSGTNLLHPLFKDMLSIPVLFLLNVGPLISLCILVWSYKTTTVPLLGFRPRDLMKDHYIKKDYKYMIHCYLCTLDLMIDDFTLLNNIKGQALNWSMNILVTTFLLSFSVTWGVYLWPG